MSKVRHFRDARTSEICIQMAAGNIDSVDALHLMQDRIDALVASYEAKVADFAAETLRTGELTARIAELEHQDRLREQSLGDALSRCANYVGRIAELEQELLHRAACNHPDHYPLLRKARRFALAAEKPWVEFAAEIDAAISTRRTLAGDVRRENPDLRENENSHD